MTVPSEPKPEAKREGQQARYRLSAASMAYLRRISQRTGLRQNQVVDQLVTQAREVETRVRKLGFRHVGEALAVLERERG